MRIEICVFFGGIALMTWGICEEISRRSWWRTYPESASAGSSPESKSSRRGLFALVNSKFADLSLLIFYCSAMLAVMANNWSRNTRTSRRQSHRKAAVAEPEIGSASNTPSPPKLIAIQRPGTVRQEEVIKAAQKFASYLRRYGARLGLTRELCIRFEAHAIRLQWLCSQGDDELGCSELFESIERDLVPPLDRILYSQVQGVGPELIRQAQKFAKLTFNLLTLASRHELYSCFMGSGVGFLRSGPNEIERAVELQVREVEAETSGAVWRRFCGIPVRICSISSPGESPSEYAVFSVNRAVDPRGLSRFFDITFSTTFSRIGPAVVSS